MLVFSKCCYRACLAGMSDFCQSLEKTASPIKGECHPYSEVLQLSLKMILMSNIVAPPCLRSTVLTQFSSAVSGWGCSRRSLWATEPFLSFSQTFKLLLTRNRNTGALLCTMSSTTAWAKRSTRPPQVCWLTVSPILPTIRTASALGCSPTWTGTPLLRTPGDTLGKVSFVLPPCVCLFITASSRSHCHSCGKGQMSRCCCLKYFPNSYYLEVVPIIGGFPA